MICSICRQEKETYAVSPRTRKQTKVCTDCWEKHFAATAKSIEHHKEKQRLEDKAAKIKRVVRNRAFIKEILANAICMDCGYSNWIALDFDHRDLTTKETEVSRMLNDGLTLERLKKEIAKCDVVCSNCHRIRTASRAGSWRTILEM